jgi:hypothetical protein
MSVPPNHRRLLLEAYPNNGNHTFFPHRTSNLVRCYFKPFFSRYTHNKQIMLRQLAILCYFVVVDNFSVVEHEKVFVLVRVCVRVVLVGVLAERFLALKEKKGIVNNTELVRLLLTDALNKEEPQPHGDVHPQA